MPRKVIAKFEVEYLQILDESAKLDAKLAPKLSKDQEQELLRLMVLTRLFDEKQLKLQRQGRVGTFASTQGHEAIQVGSALAAGDDDWFFPIYRDWGVFIARKAPLHQLYAYSSGDERSMNLPKGVNVFPMQIVVGAQGLHATGAAMASRLQDQKWCSIVYCGDGATSEGDFYEAMNFAGVFEAPVVFIVENNQWAISVSRSCGMCKGKLPCSCQTMAETIAQKAIAAGIDCIQVDGMDVLAVYKATQDALKKARSGEGPTLIECITYRFGPHTTADDPTRYRDQKENEAWQKRDGVDRFKKFLISKKAWSEKQHQELINTLTKEIEDAVVKFEALPPPNPTDFFDYMFEKPTLQLAEQRAEFQRSLQSNQSLQSGDDNRAQGGR